jgi:hypothetical protein
MRRGAVTFGRALMIVLLLALPSASQSVVYWDDDFENHLAPNWPYDPSDPCYPDGCNPQISADLAHSGTHSLKGHYTGLDSGRWIDRYYPATEEVWTRFYYRTTNFTYNNVGTKHFHLGDGVHYPNFWISNNAGRRDMMVYGQNTADPNCGSGGSQGVPFSQSSPGDCLYYANVATVNLNDDQWYCIEIHLRMNTPGVSDGIAQIYVDGKLTTNYTNAGFRGVLNQGPNLNSSSSTFNFTRIFVQHGVGDMFYDQFAVGNTRIPCGASPATSPNPPTQTQLR